MRGHQVIQSLIKFPPDLSLGWAPTSSRGYRLAIMIINLLKNIVPLVIWQRFQTIILSESFDDISELFTKLVAVLPYTLLILIIFPLNAAMVKTDRYYQNLLAVDLDTSRKALYPENYRLPLTDQSYDLFNNRNDMFNKIFYYSGFGAFPLSFTLPLPDSLIFLILGLLLFAIQGYQLGYWMDIQNRVKVKTIKNSQEMLGIE